MTPSRDFRRFSLLLLLTSLLAAPAAPAPRQPASPSRSDNFEESSQVVAVEVPVNVVDRDGRPVRGLTAADFEVFDQGDAQKITGFEVVDLSRTEAAAAPVEEPRSSSARRHFLLLFDLSYSNPTAILKARLAAREFLLNSLHPHDVAAVATFSAQRGPRLVVAFTPDRAQLARAIDTLGLRTSIDPTVERDPLHLVVETPGSGTELTRAEDSLRDAVRAQRDQAMLDNIRAITMAAEQSERTFAAARITGFTRALSEMAKALNAVNGRKQVIYFSEGFDSKLLLGRADPGSQEAEADTQNIMRGQVWMTDNDNRFGNTGLQNDLHRMLEEFRRADCVIQAIDIGGLRADVAGGPGAQPRGAGQESLFYMANETGGELFRNANDFGDQLEQVLERTSVTYVLSFERTDLRADGAFRRLRVKVKDLPSGARVSHRVGYYAPRPFQELHPLERNLLASNGIVNAVSRRDVDLNVLATPFRATPTQAYVPVIIEVAGKTLLEGHRGNKLTVEFFTYASDSQEQMRDFFSQLVTLDLGKGREAIEKTGLKYYGHLDLPPGDYRLRILVRNAETGRTGIQSVRVAVPSYEQAQASLLPPLFMEDRQGWVMVREKEGETTQASVVYPFTVKGQPYVPAARPILERARSASLCLVAYNLGQGDLDLEGKVLAADGKALPAGRLSLVERTTTGINGLDKLLATFDPSGLQAGSYVLQVAVKNPATGRQEVNSLPFTIR